MDIDILPSHSIGNAGPGPGPKPTATDRDRTLPLPHTGTNILFLPPELLSQILSNLPLESLISASQLSTHFRSICSSPLLDPWKLPISSLIHPTRPWDTDSLETVSRLPPYQFLIPRSNWVKLFVTLPREFVLYDIVHPHSIGDAGWEEVCRMRFLRSLVVSRTKVEGVGRGGWRRFYLEQLSRMHARFNSFSSRSDSSMVQFLVLRRNGRLTLNRISTREYNPLNVYEIIKSEASISQTKHPTKTLTLPSTSQSLFPDVEIVFYLSTGSKESFMSNREAGEVLRSLFLPHQPRDRSSADADAEEVRQWDEEGLEPLGPVLITARLADDRPVTIPTPIPIPPANGANANAANGARTRTAGAAAKWESFTHEDFFEIVDRVEREEEEEGWREGAGVRGGGGGFGLGSGGSGGEGVGGGGSLKGLFRVDQLLGYI